MSENNQFVTGGFQFTPFAILPQVLTLRDEALAASALIGKVENADQNNQSAAARKQIKSILSLFETNRKKFKEPILEAGRQLDRTIENERIELLKEDARLELLEKEFIRAEMRRRAEEEELQRKELERIEAEKQQELLRIAREQAAREQEAARIAAEAERKAREEREAAERLAREAKNNKEREAAEAARIEAEKRAAAAKAEADRIAAESQARAAADSQAALERASQASLIESKPPEIMRAKGQTVKKVWIIDQINDFQLMKSRPDLVRKIEWDMAGLKQALEDSDGKVIGVTAHPDISIGNRGRKNLSAIEV